MQTWHFDEFKHCGIDYSTKENAQNYDKQHQSFRDYEKEFNEMIEFLGLKDTSEMTLIDLGCGTGATTICAAKRFKKVYGVDVSKVMIDEAKQKMRNHSISNIDFSNAGFLSYNHKNEAVDLISTKAAFHHLPDFWKQIALFRMNKMLKSLGILYLFDVVYNFDAKEYVEKINSWISHFEKNAGVEFKKEIEVHIKEEFSTFTWILEKMIRNAGFKIIKKKSNDDFITEYFCVKNNDIMFDEIP
jgi:putative AdoMet-dependent methyltransferase